MDLITTSIICLGDQVMIRFMVRLNYIRDCDVCVEYTHSITPCQRQLEEYMRPKMNPNSKYTKWSVPTLLCEVQ